MDAPRASLSTLMAELSDESAKTASKIGHDASKRHGVRVIEHPRVGEPASGQGVGRTIGGPNAPDEIAGEEGAGRGPVWSRRPAADADVTCRGGSAASAGITDAPLFKRPLVKVAGVASVASTAGRNAARAVPAG